MRELRAVILLTAILLILYIFLTYVLTGDIRNKGSRPKGLDPHFFIDYNRRSLRTIPDYDDYPKKGSDDRRQIEV